MKSKKNFPEENLRYKVGRIIETLLREKMVEVLALPIISVTGVFLAISLDESPWWYAHLSGYITGERAANIGNFFAIKIGIYITVWSIFATSTSKMAKKMLENRMDRTLAVIVSLSILLSLSVVIFVTFVPSDIFLYSIWMAILVLVSLTLFVRFSIYVIKMSHTNIQLNIKEIDEKEKFDTDIQHKINELYNHKFKK